MSNDEHIAYHSELQRESADEKFETILREMPAGEISLQEILEIFEDDGLLLFSIFLALIFLVPVSIPGVSTAFGSAILLIGVARLFNRHLWLPKKISARTVAAEKLAHSLKKALPWLHRLGQISRPHRLALFTLHPVLHLANKLAFVLAAVLLMAPFGLIPFSNTLPAVALIFLAFGEMEKDGVSILLGHLVNLATIVYFGFLVTGGGLALFEGLKSLSF